MKKTMEHMKCYVGEINTKKSNLVFRKNIGKEDIHEDDMENRMHVLYGFLKIFKVYSSTYLFQNIYFSNPRGTCLLVDGSDSPRGVQKIYSEIILSSDFWTIRFKNSMKHLRKFRRTSGEYADFPIGIERIGTEVLASDVIILIIHESGFGMDNGFNRSPNVDSFAS